MTEQSPGDQHQTQSVLQAVVAAVTETHSGDDVDTVTDAISLAISEAGIGPQPEKWLRDTAAEIAEGRHVVVDRTLDAGAGGSDSTQ